jgi:hypothetical protein
MNNEKKLRIALRMNALSSGTFGILGLIFAGEVVELLGTGNELLVRLIAAGLAGFAAFVLFVSTRPLDELKGESLLISAGDLGWVLASAVLVIFGVFSTAGTVVTVAVAVMVLDFAIIQLRTRSNIANA